MKHPDVEIPDGAIRRELLASRGCSFRWVAHAEPHHSMFSWIGVQHARTCHNLSTIGIPSLLTEY